MQFSGDAISRVLFHPGREGYGYAPSGVATETRSGDATICGYFHDNRESDKLLVFFHGNGELASDYDGLAGFFNGCGASFWVIDYRGYGRSTGFPSFPDMLTDAEAVIDFIPSLEKKVGRSLPVRIVMGRSLGSAPAVHLARKRGDKLSGLILDSPYADGPALVRRLGGSESEARETMKGRDNIDNIRRCFLPALIIHGTEDFIIPVGDAEALFDALPEPDKRFVGISGAGHNDLLLKGVEEYGTELKKFIAKITKPAGKNRLPVPDERKRLE